MQAEFRLLFECRRFARRFFAALVLVTSALSAHAQTPGVALQPENVSQDVRLLFQLAELFNPAIFSGASGWYSHEGYTYQYFADSRVHAGVRNGEVFLMGGPYGKTIVPVGSAQAVLDSLMRKTGANVLTLSRERMVFEYGAADVYKPSQSFTLTSKVPTGWSLQPDADWISLSTTSGTTADTRAVTVSINANAARLGRGKYTATVAVRNARDPSLSVNLPVVLWVTDLGRAVTQSTADELAFDVTDMASDSRNGRLYFSDQNTKRVYQVDALTGLTTRYFQFDRIPERMAISPDGEKLYVALLERPPGCCSWQAERPGAIGIINLTTASLLGAFPVDIEPFDLVATADGKVVVSSAAAQGAAVHAYDAATGARVGEVRNMRGGLRLSLHPSQQWVYAATTQTSPSDIEMYDISGVGIRYRGESMYHGERRMEGNVWVAPGGRHLFTRGGDVFMASSLLYATSLDETLDERIEDLAFDGADNSAVILTDSGKLRRYDLAGFEFLSTLATGVADARFIAIIEGEVIAVDLSPGEHRLRRFQ